MSLKLRIATAILCLAAALVAAVLFATLHQSLDATRAHVARTDDVTLGLFRSLARIGLLTDDYAELQAFIERADIDPRLRSVILADAASRIVASSDPSRIGLQLDPALPHRPPDLHVVELSAYGHELGTLVAEFSDAPLVEAYQDAYRFGLGIAVPAALVLAVAGLGLAHLLTRPLARLAVAADRVTAGDLTARAELSGTDEVARVGRAFDQMVERLAGRFAGLTLARDRLLSPTEAMNEGFAVWDTDDRLVLSNRRLREMLPGVIPDDHGDVGFATLARRSLELLVDTGDIDPGAWLERRRAAHLQGNSVFELRDRRGRWLRISESLIPGGGVVGIYTDITEIRERQLALERSELRLRAIMDSVSDAILTVDAAGRIESANRRAASMFARPPELLRGEPVASLFEGQGSEPGIAGQSPPAALLDQGLGASRELVAVRGDGTRFAAETSVSVADWGEGSARIVTVRDISERKRAEALILYQATHDSLTGLPNRALFHERLDEALRRARRSGEMLAVMFLDLDRFKTINDSLGHAAGDALLAQAAGRFTACLREQDTVARMGGDEFIVLLRGLDEARQAGRAARRLLACLEAPFHLQMQEVFVTGSLGISLYPTDAADADALLRHADTALYRAKSHGRSQFQLFDASMNADTARRITLETMLRRACELGQLHLVYQPQIDLASGEVIAVEALLRWTHDELGPIAPQEFVPLAEETGLIASIGDWVLQRACTDLRDWRRSGAGQLRVAVNVSGRQFQQVDLAKRLERLLRRLGLPASAIELELTETALMREDASTNQAIADLQRLGVGLALDDFGTGYSSLSYLRRFPVQRVKIDRSFVCDMARSERDAALAGAVTMLAHGLGMRVVAEGVETGEQLACLRDLNCDEAQGYLLGRPTPAAQVPRLLRLAA
jgi:diguanylate cyclase (GGDEF)-like protein/PAS domain S-box-containing protein